jgi:hypothetical protein
MGSSFDGIVSNTAAAPYVPVVHRASKRPCGIRVGEAFDLTMRVAEGVIGVPEIATALAHAWDRRAE